MLRLFSRPGITEQSELVTLVRAFLRWWGTSLRSCFPKNTKVSESKRTAILTLPSLGAPAELGSVENRWASEVKTRMLEIARGHDKITLLLSSRDVFKRTLRMPRLHGVEVRELAAASSAELPFSDSDIIRAYRSDASDGDPNVLVATEYTTRRHLALELISAAKACRLEVDCIGVDGEQSGASGLCFLADPTLENASRAQLAKWMILALSILLGASAFWAINVRQDRQIVKLETQISAIETEALVVREAVTVMADKNRRISDVRSARQKNAQALDVLLRLTTAIGDESYLNQLQINGRTVQVSGLAGNAALVFEEIEAMPGFSEVAFTAPTTSDPTSGFERFGLKLVVIDTTSARDDER